MGSFAKLQQLLLDLISPLPQVDEESVAALTTADWEQILVMVRRHRLGPLLHWQLTRSRPGLSIPEIVQAELAAGASV